MLNIGLWYSSHLNLLDLKIKFNTVAYTFILQLKNAKLDLYLQPWR